MEKIDKDVFLLITEYLNEYENYFFLSTCTGSIIGISFLNYRNYYFKMISIKKLSNCFSGKNSRIINEEINCLHYYNRIVTDIGYNFHNSELLDFTFSWLSELTYNFLSITNIHKFQSHAENYFTNKIIRKKIAYSTGLRDKVFIRDHTLVCSIYGCKLLGSTRRKIMRSLLLKALIG
jgi:hypothetical protein